MKKIYLLLTLTSLIFFSSCKKDTTNNPSSPSSPPVLSDTLTTGWKKINFVDSSYLLDIFFINNTGFAVGPNIYKSLDGGENWSQLTSPSDLGSLFNIGMGNEMNAIFLAPNQLVVTHNGGESFTSKVLGDPNISDIFFTDSTVAYAIGNSVWKTNDAGDNWTKLYDFPASNGFSSIFLLTTKLVG